MLDSLGYLFCFTPKAPHISELYVSIGLITASICLGVVCGNFVEVIVWNNMLYRLSLLNIILLW